MHLLGKLDLNSDGLVSALEDLVGEDGVDDCDDMMTDLISVWSDDLLILDEVQLDAINNDDQLSTEDELYQLLLANKAPAPSGRAYFESIGEENNPRFSLLATMNAKLLGRNIERLEEKKKQLPDQIATSLFRQHQINSEVTELENVDLPEAEASVAAKLQELHDAFKALHHVEDRILKLKQDSMDHDAKAKHASAALALCKILEYGVAELKKCHDDREYAATHLPFADTATPGGAKLIASIMELEDYVKDVEPLTQRKLIVSNRALKNLGLDLSGYFRSKYPLGHTIKVGKDLPVKEAKFDICDLLQIPIPLDEKQEPSNAKKRRRSGPFPSAPAKEDGNNDGNSDANNAAFMQMLSTPEGQQFLKSPSGRAFLKDMA